MSCRSKLMVQMCQQEQKIWKMSQSETDKYSLDTRKKILIGCTGSVAALKLPQLVNSLLKIRQDIVIKVITTSNAKHFYKIYEIPTHVKVYSDEDEWRMWQNRGDPVLHIDLAKWADVMVIAPLDANTLAKMSQGICDNLLTCTTRAWIMHKPLLFCPAMNTRMWEHPITEQQIDTLKSWGHTEISPISKTLMCGDKGMGAMAEVDTIVNSVNALL